MYPFHMLVGDMDFEYIGSSPFHSHFASSKKYAKYIWTLCTIIEVRKVYMDLNSKTEKNTPKSVTVV